MQPELRALGVARIDDTAAIAAANDSGLSDTRVPRPVLLVLPAMGMQASYYAPLSQRLAAVLDATVVLADLRGQGVWREARAARRFGYADIVERDLPALVERLAVLYPARPLFVVGHSLGGQLALLGTAHFASRLAGLVLVASGTAHWRSWPAPQRLRAALTVHAIRLAATVLPAYPGRWLGFGGNQPRRFMGDWSHNATTGAYRLGGSSTDYAAALATVRLPVLTVRVADDPVAPAGAVDELVARLPAAAHERMVVSGVLTDSPWRRHFTWARMPEEIVSAIAPWVRKRCIRTEPDAVVCDPGRGVAARHSRERESRVAALPRASRVAP